MQNTISIPPAAYCWRIIITRGENRGMRARVRDFDTRAAAVAFLSAQDADFQAWHAVRKGTRVEY
jgi:hypothetical protein